MKCGDLIRLEHLETHRNLHSHNVQSPLTRRNEVSAFGEDGEGDPMDNWKIECVDPTTGLMVNSNDEIYGNSQV